MKASKEAALKETLKVLQEEKRDLISDFEEIERRMEEKDEEIIFVKKMLN